MNCSCFRFKISFPVFFSFSQKVRIKREVDSAMIDRGVHERVRLTQLYDRKREDLERQHEHVRQSLEEERSKVVRKFFL